MGAPRASGWIGCVGVVLALPSSAAASDDPGAYLTPGLLWTPTSRASRASGIGFELASAIYPKGCCYAWGPLVQGELLPADGERRSAYRGALAFQALAGPIGIDAGWAFRSDAGPTVPWASGPQVGAFFSLGFASVGVRVMLPVAHADTGLDVGEVSLVLTLKTVLLVYGESASYGNWLPGASWGRMPAGRPLVVRGVARVSPLEACPAWASATRDDRTVSRGPLLERLLRAARRP